MIFPINHIGAIGHPQTNNDNLDLNPTPCTKINLSLIDLGVKHKTTKRLAKKREIFKSDGEANHSQIETKSTIPKMKSG